MEISRRSFVQSLSAALGTLGFKDYVAAQANKTSAAPTAPFFAPKIPPYPYFIENSRAATIRQAARISLDLENYVRDWFEGRVAAELPDKLIPQGVDRNGFKNFRLIRAEDVKPEQQWALREAEELNLDGLRGGFPDPHCTYLVNPTFFAPFGSRLVLEGEFPHARFFDIQVTPSFHPESHRTGPIGVGEVPIVDADIEPLRGHTNPFRAGANRNAVKRSYRVEYSLQIGNPAELNRAFRPPYYRAAGNQRIGGALMYQGAWGDDPQYKKFGGGLGLWQLGEIWLRYYAPDHPAGVLGGVSLPKYYYELPNGRRFFIGCDWSNWLRPLSIRKPAGRTLPDDPSPESLNYGWNSQMGIARAIYTGLALGTKWANEAWVREIDKGMTGRGEDSPPPNNFEPSATSCTYINYLLKGMNLGWFKVIVITGKLPVTPRTRNGEPVMTRAQARYWSLTSYKQNLPDKDGWGGAAITSIMDDELVLDDERRYIIAYSWDGPLYRPRNSRPENGVTWRNWSLNTAQSLTLRWLSVHPEWSFPLAPNERNLGWKADPTALSFDRDLIGYNNQNGFLREYHPVVRYLTKGEFEQLGDGRIDAAQLLGRR